MYTTLFYDLALLILGILYLPVVLFQLIVKGKYQNSLFNRLGGGFPVIDKGNRPLVWIHAVSLGETKAVASLAKLIKATYNDPILIISSTTETGHFEACRSIPAEYHVYLPLDFGWIIRPIIKRTAPDLVILCESDFWYNFLSASKDAGAFVALVNGKISTRSEARFKFLKRFAQKLFSNIDLFCLQSNVYKERFLSLGIDASKLVVTGNMKFDGDYARLPVDHLSAWRNELSIKEDDKVLVIGSTHSPEEEQILSVLIKVWKNKPNLKVLIVPRHPERFNEVAGILQKNNINFRRLSQKDGSLNQREAVSVILVDAMGLLRKCYQLADVALVAGSYAPKVGGHNILEPCWYGVPTLFGPIMYGQPDMVDLVLEYKAGDQVPLEELHDKLIELIDNHQLCEDLGRGGLRLAADVHGASEKTLEFIKSHTDYFPLTKIKEKKQPLANRVE